MPDLHTTLPGALYSVKELSILLKPLIGRTFPLTKQLRTDGVQARKVIAAQLNQMTSSYSEMIATLKPVHKMGFPKIQNQLLYTYLATPPYDTKTYNLQMWNVDIRELETPLVQDENGQTVWTIEDAKIVILWVDRNVEKIESISIFTPRDILEHFSIRQTKVIKNQAILKKTLFEAIRHKPLFIGNDYPLDLPYQTLISHSPAFTDLPHAMQCLTLSQLGEQLKGLIGTTLKKTDMKHMGQSVERLVIQQLGYSLTDTDRLHGKFPDIPHQLLEVKLQNKGTMDLGRYTPFQHRLLPGYSVSSKDIRYAIIHTNKHHVISAISLLSGRDFPHYFQPVQSQNYKIQCSIPLDDIYYNQKGKVFTF